MKIAIRVDSSNSIGTGHVMRCLSLADELQNKCAQVIFVVREHLGHIYDIIEAKGYKVFRLNSKHGTESKKCKKFSSENNKSAYAAWLGVDQSFDAEQTVKVLQKGAPWDWILVDHYSLDYRWENSIRQVARKIMVIDDLANRRHECDILLDQTHGRNAYDYRLLVPNYCDIRIGANYALLRPDFYKKRLTALQNRDARKGKLENILVCMGGSDPENVTKSALVGIRKSGLNVDVDIMIGAGSPNLYYLQEFLTDFPQAQLYIDTPKVPELMSRADIAIGAGGTTSWERCCMGLPTLAVTLAENQSFIVNYLAKVGAVQNLGRLSENIEELISKALKDLKANPQRIYAMSIAARDICNGMGAKSLADIIINQKVT